MIADEDDDRALFAGHVLERVSSAVRRRKPEVRRRSAEDDLRSADSHCRVSFSEGRRNGAASPAVSPVSAELPAGVRRDAALPQGTGRRLSSIPFA
jgi:hypothetical protein